MDVPDGELATQQEAEFAHFRREDFEHRIGLIAVALEGDISMLEEEDMHLLGQMYSSWVEYENIEPLLTDPRLREAEQQLAVVKGTTAEDEQKKRNMLTEWMVYFEKLRDKIPA